MRFSFQIGDSHKIKIDFFRSGFWGAVSILADGKEVYKRSPLNPFIHFSTSLVRKYTFQIREPEHHEISVEKKRPLILAGLRSSQYEVFCDGNRIGEFSGY